MLLARVALGLGLILLWAGPARAACGAAERPWVSVTFAAGPWPGELRASVLGDLGAGLRRRGIDACAAGDGPESSPVAAVRITRETSASVVVAVEVRDAVTEKRVSRDLDLGGVPEDGRSFAIALAADELVWASWAELGLKHRRPPARTPPREVIAGVEKERPEPDGPGARLGAIAAAERYLGGQTHLGGDVALLLPVVPRLQLGFQLGYRHGLDVSAPSGTITSRAVPFTAEGRYLLIRGNAVELGFGLGVRAAGVRFEGEASEGATASVLDGVAVYARSGLSTSVRVGGGIWIELGAGMGLPLRALEATDGGAVVAGVSGVEIAGHFGLMLEL